MSRWGRRHRKPPLVARLLSPEDRLYLKAYGKLILCERRRPDEERELQRRRLADGSYPVPAEIDEARSLPLAPRFDLRSL